MQLKGSPFAWVSFAMAVGVMSTALISPLYPIYKTLWQLQTSDIAIIYVVYMSGALCGLMFLGRLPDKLGFQRVMLWALVLAEVGSLLSMLAWGMSSLLVGRFIVGVASSLMITGASMGLGVLSPVRDIRRTAMVTGFLIAFGFGLGPLVGGIMGEWAPHPLVTAYLPTLFLGVIGLYALHTLALPEKVQAAARGVSAVQWRDCLPKLTWADKADSIPFVLTCGLPFLAFGVFGLYASMAPLFLVNMVSWHGPFVSGATIFLILLASATVQVLSGKLPPHLCGFWGLLALVASNALLVLNLWAGTSAIFVIGVVLTSIGHGMSMLAGMNMVNRIAKQHNRSGMLSTYLVVGYIGSMVPMMGMGWIADHWGLNAALISFCLMVVVLGSILAVTFVRHPRVYLPGS